MNLKGIKLITFDATNTLLKFKVPPWKYYAAVARDYGYRGTEDQLKGHLLQSYKEMWEEYPNFGKNKITWEDWWRQVVTSTFEGHLPAGANVETLSSRLIDEFKTTKCWYIADGGNKIIKLLRGYNITLGVISNFDPRLCDILRNVNIEKHFNFVLTSYEIGYSKPDKRIFNVAIEKCKNTIHASESLHIGDDVKKDYEGARAAGWNALLICDKINTGKPLASKHVFRNLEELSLAIEQNTLKL